MYDGGLCVPTTTTAAAGERWFGVEDLRPALRLKACVIGGGKGIVICAVA